ncbi:MAG: hypothetical protein WBO04_03040, partial [Steroidobacteraceae bacterium]
MLPQLHFRSTRAHRCTLHAHEQNVQRAFIIDFGSVTIPAFGCDPRMDLASRSVQPTYKTLRVPTTEDRHNMKTAIVKTLTVGVAALMLAVASGCTSQETLAKIDAADAAAKAAAQDAAAAKSAA